VIAVRLAKYSAFVECAGLAADINSAANFILSRGGLAE
jgi:hypothetical protein